MKHNLKTFPNCCLDEKHYCERDAWKAEFEAELRERLRRIYEFDIEAEMKRINNVLVQNEIYSVPNRDVEKQAFENMEIEKSIQFEKLLKEIFNE